MNALNCCCKWGAAMANANEWPEDPCAWCPKHGEPDVARICKKHRKNLSRQSASIEERERQRQDRDRRVYERTRVRIERTGKFY